MQAGVIGNVREVHVWTNRPIWPQGLLTPAPMSADFDPLSKERSWGNRAVAESHAGGLWAEFRPPPEMDWDLYLGPARPVKYHPIYHP
ncbi:MAG: hypothetical protein GWO04_04930, partial [Actinobacteria bacterium]|nr:hypothetical protein [Actinomycetota bacterium]NIV54568.1 hypothetical protein [Actinomycetota bacterium]